VRSGVAMADADLQGNENASEKAVGQGALAAKNTRHLHTSRSELYLDIAPLYCVVCFT